MKLENKDEKLGFNSLLAVCTKSILITQEQKEEIARVAKEKKISVTQLVIDSIQFYNDYIQKVEKDSTILDDKSGIENDSEKVENSKERIESDSIIPEVEIYKEMTETLKEQLKQKDIQIDQLHKIVYNKDTLLIETSIEKKHWWQFWKSSDKE